MASKVMEKVPSWVERLLFPRLSTIEGDLKEMRGEFKALYAEIGRIDEKMDSSTKLLDEKMDSSTKRLDERIDLFTKRLDEKIDSSTKRLDEKIDSLTQRLEGKIDSTRTELGVKVDSLEKRLDVVGRLAVAEAQIRELHDKLAAKSS